MSKLSEAKQYLKENPNQRLPIRFKERWLEALTDGSYEQATGALIVVNEDEEVQGHCCLGVACRIQGLSQSAIIDYGDIDQDLAEIAKKRKKNIPKILQNDENNGHNPVLEHLIDLNDSSTSFNRVVKFIEKYL